MTWTKTGVEFPDDAANVDLSDAAYRTHHEAITWLFRVERIDCLIPIHLVRRFAGSPHYEIAIQELVAHGWWRVTQKAYEVLHHADVIRGGIVAQQKKLDRDKRNAAAYRKRKDISDDVSADADRQTNNQPAITGSDYNDDSWLAGRTAS